MISLKKQHSTTPEKDELQSRMLLESKDKQLLQMIFAPHISPDEKIDFFRSLNIEDESTEFNLMLAHLCHRHGYQDIPSAMVPRLRGVARFYLFKNAALFRAFGSLAHMCNQACIPLLLLKGAAIKANYDPTSSRCLVDIDFAVPKERLAAAIQLAETQGFHILKQAFHAVNMKQSEANGSGGSIDIHHCLFKTSNTRCFEDELAEGAQLISFFGAKMWVPAPESLLLHIIENEFYNLCSIITSRRHFKWIYDCGLILSSSLNFEWACLANTARRYGIYKSVRLMLFILSDHLPQYVLKTTLANYFPLEPLTPMTAMENIVFINLDRCSQNLRRERLYANGNKWKSLFLWPSYMLSEYRALHCNGKVRNFSEFMLRHCQARNFSGVVIWLWTKLRLWNSRKRTEINGCR